MSHRTERLVPVVPLFALLALGLACSDYNLHTDPGEGHIPPEEEPPPDPPEEEPPPEDDDTTPDPSGLCEDEYLPPVETPVDGTCAPEAVGSFTPVVEWELASFPVASTSTSIMMPPAVANLTDDDGDGDVDEDDVPDVVVITYAGGSPFGGVVRAVSGDGVHLWSAQVNAQGQAGVSIGDIDGDGLPEVVTVTSDWKPIALRNDGTTLWTGPASLTGIPIYCASPALGDMDGDGAVEVGIGRLIVDGATGARIAEGTRGLGGSGVGSTSFFADVDLDGRQELMAGNAAYRKDGSTAFTYGSGDGYPAVADFDGDDQAEVVVVTVSEVTLYDTAGATIWGPVAIPGGGGGPPTVADFDGDGAPEIGVGSFGAYTVFETDGTRKWSRTTEDGSSGITGSTVFDFEGDGVAEVVYADETRLWVFSGPDGAVKLEGLEHSSATWIEYPAIADVDGDGHAEIVYGRNPNLAGDSRYGIAVVGDADDSWMPARPIWNQHAYSITNVEDDGAIPTHPAPNWLEYNSFRSADLVAATGGVAADLVARADVCSLDCDTFGTAWLSVYALNQGTGDVESPVRVSVYRKVDAELLHLDTVVVDQPIPSGWSAPGVRIPLDAEFVGDAALVVAVDDDGTGLGTVPECREENNRFLIPAPVCP
ncbi:VCBS repeat-containing protein [Myxococcota bacterium]|nr:VCBS repeat-containing protein [Myxococcota bacterium]